MSDIYQLNYSTEDYNKDFGYFTTKDKAEEAKKELIGKVKDNMKEYWEREINIYKIEINKIICQI